jgi:hypothetical protein
MYEYNKILHNKCSVENFSKYFGYFNKFDNENRKTEYANCE